MDGFERQVLKGATEVLAYTDSILLDCFCDYTPAFGFAPDDLIPLMQRASFHGYRLSAAEDENSLMPLADSQRSGALEKWLFVRQSAFLGHRYKIYTFVN